MDSLRLKVSKFSLKMVKINYFMVVDSCICNCATSYISATVLRYTFLFYAKGYDKLKIAMDHVTPRVKILHPLFFKITLTQRNYSDYSCGYIRSANGLSI